MKIFCLTVVMFFQYITIAHSVEIVVKDGKNNGIKSIISLQYNNKTSDHGPTDEDGYMGDLDKCMRGAKFLVFPESPDYYKAKEYCNPSTENLVIQVTKKVHLVELIESAKQFEEMDELGSAALLYSEIAAKLQNIPSSEFDEIISISREKSTAYFVITSNLMPPKDALFFDPSQDSYVMSEEYSEKLKEWQSMQGLKQTGVIDFRSLSKLSSAGLGENPINDKLLKEIKPKVSILSIKRIGFKL
jgi:hypothetical protein